MYANRCRLQESERQYDLKSKKLRYDSMQEQQKRQNDSWRLRLRLANFDFRSFDGTVEKSGHLLECEVGSDQ